MSEPAAAKRSGLRSAESVVVIALLAVCLAVGAAYWVLASKDRKAAAGGTVATGDARPPGAPAAGQAEEKDALDAWNRKLQGDFADLDRQRQTQEQRAEQEREKRKAEAEAEAERERQKAEAEAARGKQKAGANTAEAAASSPAGVAQDRTPPPAPAPIAAAAPPPVVPAPVEARVDWSTCSQPQYPRASVELGEQGIVVLNFRLDAGGNVLGGEITATSGSARLDEAALHALEKCRFKPATLDGVAVAAATKVRFKWQLRR